MTIFTETYIPYEFNNRHECLQYIEQRCMNIKKALRLIEKDNEHLKVRCPLSGDYLDVIGTIEELEWIDKQLRSKQWYRI